MIDAFVVWFLAGVFVASGVVVMTVARRGRDGRLRRNELVGLRTRATLSSDEAWLAAHRASYGASATSGLIAILGGAFTLLARSNGALAAVVTLTCVAILALTFWGAYQGNRAARAVHDEGPWSSSVPGGS